LNFNLICGSLLGIVAVLAGPIGEHYVSSKFAKELQEKSVYVPSRTEPDKLVLEISTIDRQLSEQRFQQYEKGSSSIGFNSLALLALGAVTNRGYGRLVGCIGLMLGAILYGGGLLCGAFFDMPLFSVAAPVGAILLFSGWLGVLISAIELRSTSNA